MIGRDHNRFIPEIERTRETARVRVLVDVRIVRVEGREFYVIAAAQQNWTRRREEKECTRRAISNFQINKIKYLRFQVLLFNNQFSISINFE